MRRCHSCNHNSSGDWRGRFVICCGCGQEFCSSCFEWESRFDTNGDRHYFCSYECAEESACDIELERK